MALTPGVQAGADGAQAFLSWLMAGQTNSDVANAQRQSLAQALGIIDKSAGTATTAQQPFLKGGTDAFQKYQGLVNSNYYQTPYNQSFTGQTPSQNNFSFNPGQGSANFGRFQPQGGPATFTPPSMPGMPQMPPTQAPQAQGQAPSQFQMRPNPQAMVGPALQTGQNITPIYGPNSGPTNIGPQTTPQGIQQQIMTNPGQGSNSVNNPVRSNPQALQMLQDLMTRLRQTDQGGYGAGSGQSGYGGGLMGRGA